MFFATEVLLGREITISPDAESKVADRNPRLEPSVLDIVITGLPQMESGGP